MSCWLRLCTSVCSGKSKTPSHEDKLSPLPATFRAIWNTGKENHAASIWRTKSEDRIKWQEERKRNVDEGFDSELHLKESLWRRPKSCWSQCISALPTVTISGFTNEREINKAALSVLRGAAGAAVKISHTQRFGTECLSACALNTIIFIHFISFTQAACNSWQYWD